MTLLLLVLIVAGAVWIPRLLHIFLTSTGRQSPDVPDAQDYPVPQEDKGLQRSTSPNPNGLLTWLPHRTVSGAPCDSTLPTATFGGWGYKYPNHPTFNGIQVFHLQHITRAIAFNSRHTKEIKSSPKSKDNSNQ